MSALVHPLSPPSDTADPWDEGTAVEASVPPQAGDIPQLLLEELDGLASTPIAPPSVQNPYFAADAQLDVDDDDDDDCWEESTCVDPSLANAPVEGSDDIQVQTVTPSDVFGPSDMGATPSDIPWVDPQDPFGAAALPDEQAQMRRELLGEGFEKSAEQVLEDALDAALGAFASSAPPAPATSPVPAVAPIAQVAVAAPDSESPFKVDTPPPRSTDDLDVFVDFGRFMLVEKIGGSPEAEIWKAIESLGDGCTRPCVVRKMVPAKGDAHKLRAARFHAEARLGLQLKHPNLVNLLSSGERDDTAYVVREYLEGVNLDRLVERAGDDGLELAALLALGQRIATVLAYAHGGRTKSGKPINLFHGAISPSSILIGADGEPKITELSVTAIGGRKLNALTEARAARPGYESPEQRDGKHAHCASDIFALGMVLVELVGRRPLGGDGDFADEETEQTVRLWCTLRRDLPKDLTPLLLAMTARDVDKRPSAQDVKTRLEKMLSEVDEDYDLQAGLRHYIAADESVPAPASIDIAEGIDIELSIDDPQGANAAAISEVRAFAQAATNAPTLPEQIGAAEHGAPPPAYIPSDAAVPVAPVMFGGPPDEPTSPERKPTPLARLYLATRAVAPDEAESIGDDAPLGAPDQAAVPVAPAVHIAELPLALEAAVPAEAAVAPAQIVRGAPVMPSAPPALEIEAPRAPPPNYAADLALPHQAAAMPNSFGAPQVVGAMPATFGEDQRISVAAPMPETFDAEDPRPIEQIMVDLALGGVSAPSPLDHHARLPSAPVMGEPDRAALAGITSPVASPAFFSGATAATPLPRPTASAPWWIYAVGALIIVALGVTFVGLG